MKVLEKTEFSNQRFDLDLKDKKILKMLSVNSRFPLTRISKYVKLTRDAVRYRIERLEQNSVINGYLTLVNVKKLDYISFHIFVELHADTEKEKEFVKFLTENKNVNAVIKYSGKLDYEVAIIVKDFQELNKIFTEFMNKCKLRDYEILAILSTIKSSTFPEKLLNEKILLKPGKSDGSFFKEFFDKEEELKLDKKDFEILSFISDNARISLIELGKKTKLSQDAISYRIKKMVRSKLILEFRPVVNFSKLGFYVYAVLLRLENFEKEKNLENFLKNHPNVLWAVKTLGKWNILFYIITSNEEEFHSTMADLKNRFSDTIKNYEVLLANEEFKYTYFPEILKEA